MFDRVALPRVLPFVAYIFFIFVADMLSRFGYSADQLRSLYAVKIAVVVVLLWYFRHQYSELAWRPMRPALVLGGVAAGLIVLVLWLNLGAGWMTVGTSAGFDPTRNGEVDWMLVSPRIAGAALVVPVMEELFWRSFLMRWLTRVDFLALDPARAGLKGLVVCCVLFGFEHNLWLAGIVAGVVYSVLYMRCGNLWTAILAHAVTNGALGVWIVCTAQWTYW